jgi:hypothetical protein
LLEIPDAATSARGDEIRDDVAVLLVSTDEKFPPKLAMTPRNSATYAGKMMLAIIGYPGPPSDMTIMERMQYFSAPDTITPVFPYKRLSGGASGERAANADGLFAHLVNTAQGNSGGPIMDISDGAIVGIHVKGEDRNVLSAKNYGLSSERVLTVLRAAGL